MTAVVFDALADPTRRRVLELLSERDLSAGELVPLAALAQAEAAAVLELPVAVPGGGVPAGLAAGDRVEAVISHPSRCSCNRFQVDIV